MNKWELFRCFFMMGIVSFGGVLPFARRALVEKERWLTADEFNEGLSLGQILPGPNVVNLSIMLGARFHGPLGAILAFLGLMAAPFAILMLLATLYAAYGQVPAVQHLVNGTAAASAGLVLAVGWNMLSRQARGWHTAGISALSFAGCGLLAWPLLLVLGVLAPLSVFLAWRVRK
ncbi:MAG TPA: chromate transporter [Burkholderiaceae bacterium]